MAKKDLTVQDWERLIDDGLRFRNRYGIEETWAENEKLFYSVAHANQVAGPNLVFSTVDAMIAQLCVPDPYITCKARTSADVDSAPVVEAVDNHLMLDMQFRREVQAAVLSAALWGNGFIKVGYDSIWGYDGKRFDLGGRVAKMGMTLTQHNRQSEMIEFGGSKPGMPWAKFVLPHDIVVPWGTCTLDDAPWIAHRCVRHIDDLRSDPKYSNTKNIQPTLSMEDWVRSYTAALKPYRMGTRPIQLFTQGNDQCNYVEVWEIHDVRTCTVKAIVTGYTEFIRDEHDLLQIDGLPFVNICLVPRSRSLWVTPPVTYLRPAQAEATDVALQNNKQRRASVCKSIIDSNAFDEDELTKMTSSDVGVYVKTKPGVSPSQAIMQTQPYNNQNLWQESRNIEQDAQTIIGLGQNQSGNYAGGRPTATEAASVNANSQLRMTVKQSAVADLYIRSFGKINAIVGNMWQLPQEINYVGADGLPQWQKFAGEIMQRNYSLDVGFSNADETRSTEKAMATQMVQAMIPLGILDPSGVVKYACAKFNDPDIMLLFNKQYLSQVQGMQNGPGQQMPMQPSQQPGLPMSGATAPQATMGLPRPGQVPGGLRQLPLARAG